MNSKMLMLIAVIIVLVVIAGAVYVFLPRSPPPSGNTTTTTPPSVPSKILNVSIDAATLTSVKLKWDKVNNVSGYYVYSSGQRIKTVSDNTISLTSLQSNSDFTFQIAAFNNTGQEGAKSDILPFRTSLPGSASSFTCTMTATSATLNWTPVQYADIYKIAWALDYGNGVSGQYTQIDVFANVTSHTITGLTPITNYVFVLIPTNKVGTGTTKYVQGTTTAS